MKIRSRFSYFRDKLQVFILGFLLGIVLGGGFFLLKLDSYVKELSFYKSLVDKDEKKDEELEKLKQEMDKPSKPAKNKKSTSSGSSAETQVSNDTVAGGDSTLPVVFNNEAGGDEIVIRKDELLGQKTLGITSLDQPAVPDSVSGKPAADHPQGYLTVEFWKSPLNYRGYKFSRNKLVIFGLEVNELEGVFKSGNSTYLKSAIGFFRIEPSSDFRQLERVTDESLTGRMQ